MRWQTKPKAPRAFFNQFPNLPSLIVQLLYSRGFETQRQLDEFLRPDYTLDIHDPYLLNGMDKAVKRVLKAVKKGEQIAIYGDYDADGVCSTAVLYHTLKALGVKKPLFYIPDREKEGYSLNKKAVEYLAGQGVNLIITVDCGSTDFEEANLIKQLGIDLIITDHHQVRDDLPQNYAMINPWQKDDKYPFKHLAGAGVAYKLACAILDKKFPKDNPLKKWLLDIVALATVADVMPLIGENRTIVRYGVGVLAQTSWPGLMALMKVAGVEPQITQASSNGEPPVTNLNGRVLGFALGPRLNAVGRMEHANTALNLLVSETEEEADELAQHINKRNKERQAATTKIIKEIEGRLKEKIDLDVLPSMIIEGSKDWPAGLVGLVAERIKSKYNRPTIVYQLRDEQICASGRSIPQFNLIEAFTQCADYFDGFGGHKVSAAFRMKPDHLEDVRVIFEKLTENLLTNKELGPCLDIDSELEIQDVCWENYNMIQNFEPFGEKNPEPVFVTKGLEVHSVRLVGSNQNHLKLDLMMFDKNNKGAKLFKSIGFGMGDKISLLSRGTLVDIAFQMTANEWNGRKDLELKLLDLKINNKRI